MSALQIIASIGAAYVSSKTTALPISSVTVLGRPVQLLAPPAPPSPTASLPPAPASTNGGGSMSMLGDIGRAIAPALGGIVGGWYPGVGSTAGTAIGTQLANISASRRSSIMPGEVGGVTGAGFPALGAIAGTIGRAAGLGVGAAVLGARTIYRSASIYCRRHPAWCAQIGGTAAIAGMIQSGTLPPIRRRRARGISPSEFRGFRKVHKVLSGFCAPRMKVRRAKRS